MVKHIILIANAGSEKSWNSAT